MNFYEKNIEIIKLRFPDLFERLQKVEKTSRIELVEAKVGALTAKVNQKFLHSRYDPVTEAKEFVSKQELKIGDTLIVLGFGLGYHMIETSKLGIVDNMFVIDPDIEVFKAAIENNDFEKFLLTKRLSLLVGLSPVKVFGLLCEQAITFLSGEKKIVEYTPSVSLNKEYFERLRPKIVDALRTSAVSVNTAATSGKKFIENIFSNIEHIIKSPGVNRLEDKFKNMPAIIVSAGPSLDKNIDYLKTVKNKALILATDTALKILESHDIKADFVFTIDFREESILHFQSVNTKDVPLVFYVQSAKESLQAHKGKKIVATSISPVAYWINNICGDKGIIEKCMSVAHFVFHVAHLMGADPIVFIGQDLSFPDGMTHAKGTTSREEVKNGGRASGAKLMSVKSLRDNSELMTAEDMYVYLRHFEKLVASSDRICINATEGGAGIEGTEEMTLKDAIKKYCNKEIDIKKEVENCFKSYKAPDVKNILDEMITLKENLDDVFKNTKVVISLLDEIFSLSKQTKPDKVKIASLFKKMKEPLHNIESQEMVLRMVHADTLRTMIEMQAEGSIGKDKKHIMDISKDLEIDMKFQKGLNDGVSFLKGCLSKAIDQLKDN